jgi:N-acetylneuraminic acid mutarotase
MRIPIITLLICIAYYSDAQWLQQAAFPGTPRAKSTAFTIGGKIYMMGGITNASAVLNDFWEYDISANIWVQRPDFPGPERYGAASFVINSKGYISCGGNDFGFLDDLWEFDPALNIWMQKTGLPVTSAQHENQRREPFVFVAGNKAYLGGGEGFVFMPNSTANIAFYDLWEYNPAGNTWQQKSDIPDFTGRNMSVAASVNNKGYVGLGCNVDQTVNHHSFWEYEPLTDSWTPKANFTPDFTADANAFVLGSSIYIAGGVNLNPVSLSSQFYRFDPAANTWTALSNFNGGAIAGAISASDGMHAYLGTGYNGSILTRSDFWEYNIAAATEEIPLHAALGLYPNPANTFITVAGDDITNIEIFDATGKTLISSKLASEKLDISALPQSVYLVKANHRDGTVTTGRFVKTL